MLMLLVFISILKLAGIVKDITQKSSIILPYHYIFHFVISSYFSKI